MDGCQRVAKVTMVGPETWLDGVGKLIECLAKGARPLIGRLIDEYLPLIKLSRSLSWIHLGELNYYL